MIHFVTIILLPNTYFSSNFIIYDFDTDQANCYNYVFATVENETDASTYTPSVSLDRDLGGLEYNARYLYGTIIGQDGPLRPGRYD